MYYIIYQITNKINGKIYIGCHQTRDLNDGYMGSGYTLRLAIQKYGSHNFTKQILEFLPNAQKMLEREAEIVNESFINREDVYNVALGGGGGFFTSTRAEETSMGKMDFLVLVEKT